MSVFVSMAIKYKLTTLYSSGKTRSKIYSNYGQIADVRDKIENKKGVRDTFVERVLK